MIQPDLKLVFLCRAWLWWELTSTVNIQMLVTHRGLERDGQQTGSRVWAGVYTLDGMSGSLQTVKIQYSDSVLMCTEHRAKPYQNLPLHQTIGVWCRGVCVCETVFGIVYRGSASRKVCESFLWDTQYKMVTQEEDGVQQVIFTGLKNVWCQRLHSFKTLALNISLAPPDMCDIICYSMEMSPGDREWWVMLTQVITATDQS